MKHIGILALQGNFIQHKMILERLLKSKVINDIDSSTYEPILIREKKDIASKSLKALILPGGESTTMLHLLARQDLRDEIIALLKTDLPCLATCAGLILLSKKIINSKPDIPSPLALTDLIVERNAYGRQFESFHATVAFNAKNSNIKEINGLFIRAPKIVETARHIEILSRYQNSPVIVKEKHILMSSFHPEALGEVNLHKYFLEHMVSP